MIAEKLGQYIFSENIYVYAILDGAAIPDLLTRFYELRPPHVCLYRGELGADLAEVAPYLVNLQPGARFTNWLLRECWGKHWGIFLHSPYLMDEMRRHFRKFLTVHDEAGNPMVFRYYDPRVLPKFLPTCQADELEIFFRRVKTYFAESDDAKQLIRLQYPNSELKQTHLDMRQQTSGGEIPSLHAQPKPFTEFSYA